MGSMRSVTDRRVWSLTAGLLSYLALAACGGAPAVETPNFDPAAQVDALFAHFTEGIQPGAAVMVIRDGHVAHSAGYGYAEIEGPVPIRADSTFRLGSFSKQFTAMAIMLLAESGALDYDDPIARYLPELARYGEDITIRHLLYHQGGLPGYYADIDTSKGMPSNADALAELSRKGEPMFPPGERYAYSNPGYDMLAVVVEAASELRFADFMRQRIFAPLGMNDSLIHDHTGPHIARRVIGYDPDGDGPDGDGYAENDQHPLNGIVGSGSMFSTLDDLYKWDQALYTETLVSAATLEEAFTPAKLDNGEDTGYGFGFVISEYRGHRRISHGGSWVGFRTHIARHPGIGLTLILLSNRSDFRSSDYVDPVIDAYLDAYSTPSAE